MRTITLLLLRNQYNYNNKHQPRLITRRDHMNSQLSSILLRMTRGILNNTQTTNNHQRCYSMSQKPTTTSLITRVNNLHVHRHILHLKVIMSQIKTRHQGSIISHNHTHKYNSPTSRRRYSRYPRYPSRNQPPNN